MLNKQLGIFIIMLFCSSAYCAEMDHLQKSYVKAHYFGAFFNTIGPLDGKEDVDNKITEGIFSITKQERIEKGYSPQYVPGFAGSIAAGRLLNNNIRVEVEGLYSQVNLYDEDYSNKNKAKYIELRRNQATSIGTECNSPWKSGKVDINVQDTCPVVVSVDFRAAFKMKNEGFNNLAGLVNVYRDFNTRTPFIPYIGVGGGLTQVKFLNRTRYALAYQAKLGVNYPITTQANIFAGLRYFGILGNKFNNIVPVAKIMPGEDGVIRGGVTVDETARIESSTATITNKFGVYGLELGLAYHF